MEPTETEFEPQLGHTRRGSQPKLRSIRAAVRAATWVLRTRKAKVKQPSVRAHFAKGSKARARPVVTAKRRVVVKMRYASNAGGRGAPLRAHVAYLSREGREQQGGTTLSSEQTPEVGRSVDYLSREDVAGEAKFQFYDRASFEIDARTITARWADDARHFRMIVSAEDGEALGDLRPFIREVMAGLETKLGAKLEWLAVDHHDTDNPHTHVLIRGRRPDGQDLFIPSRLISSGIREHAQEIVTRVLGPRLEADLAKERWREISEIGVTPLDRQLVASQGASGIVSVHRPDLVARLERLEGWGLAQRSSQGWRIVDGLLGKLKAIEEHHQVERAVSGYRTTGELLPLLAADRTQPIEGQLVHFGPADDFGENFIAVIETGRGELRYARFARSEDLARLQDASPGAMVAFEPNVPTARPADHAIAAIAARTGGLYSAEHHVAETPGVSRGLIEANIRRLEAMRRMSLVSRSPDGVFLVGQDHLKRAVMFDERVSRRFPLLANVLSYWTQEEQVRAMGPTRLDRVLAGEAAPPQGEGAFARQHASALQQRRLVLIEQGWLRRDERLLSASAMSRMAEHELRTMASELSKELGKPVLTVSLNQVRGVYARRIDLAQGRMALIDAGRQAVLVPWRPPLDRFEGREVEGVLRGQGLSWRLQRGMGIGLPPM